MGSLRPVRRPLQVCWTMMQLSLAERLNGEDDRNVRNGDKIHRTWWLAECRKSEREREWNHRWLADLGHGNWVDSRTRNRERTCGGRYKSDQESFSEARSWTHWLWYVWWLTTSRGNWPFRRVREHPRAGMESQAHSDNSCTNLPSLPPLLDFTPTRFTSTASQLVLRLTL